jgi:hypothetical protein
MALVYLYFMLAVLIGMVAIVRGRSWLRWFLISLFITPVIAGLLVLVLPTVRQGHGFHHDFSFMSAHHIEAPPADSMLRIVRLSSYSERQYPYDIFINGAFVRAVDRNGVVELHVPSGALVVEARTGRFGSRPLLVETAPGHKVEIEVSNRGGVLRAIWAATLGSDEFLKLEQRAATYSNAAAA